MNLRHIEVFHAVFVTGSVSGGARALNVSQPSVSKVLKHAEDQLGFKLFDRISGRLIPTEKGIKLFDEVQPLVDQLNELSRFTANLKHTKSGHLRFAMTPAFGLEIGPVALARFVKNNPDITIETETLHAHQVVKALLDNQIDTGLVFDAPAFPGIQKLQIGQTEFVCIAPEGLSLPSNGPLKISDLRAYPLVTLNQKSVLGKVLSLKLEDAFDSKINSNIVVETYHLAKRLVKQNAGIAIIDSITAFSGDISGLQIRALTPGIKINVDIIMRLNEPQAKHQSLFNAELRSAMRQFREKLNLTST
ncbi:LysR family transcriptional regulator [Fretibacter rubidus]|uniref:LysR family transcriptional regulator n=1 Tax=Fretibacter rubidus TaxID=570162 RepID=UPI00352A9718